MPKVSTVALAEAAPGTHAELALQGTLPPEIPELWQRYAGALQFRERVYGGIPKNPHIFDAWLKAKQFPPDLVQENKDDVQGELEESVEAGETIFRRDSTGLYLRQFQLKGAVKEATQRLGYYVIPMCVSKPHFWQRSLPLPGEYGKQHPDRISVHGMQIGIKLKRNEDQMGLRSHIQTG